MADQVTFQPIEPNYPRALTALNNKLPRWQPALAQVDPRIAQSFLDFNMTRVQRGQYPLSDPETILALQAAQTGQAQTPKQESSWWNLPKNAMSNIRAVTSAFPRLFVPSPDNPVVSEVSGILDLPQSFADVWKDGSVRSNIADTLALPGVRLIPGTYVGEQAVEGDFGELARNPVFTALDVLPFAKKAAQSRPVVQAAQSEARALRSIALDPDLAGRLSHGLLDESLNPAALTTLRDPGVFRTVLTNRLSASGRIERNILGQITDAIADRAKAGPLGEMAGRFGIGLAGKQNRAVTRMASLLGEEVRLILHNPNTRQVVEQIAKNDPDLAGIVTRFGELQSKHAPFFDAASDAGAAATRKFEAGAWDDMTPAERAFADDLTAFNREAAVWLSGNSSKVQLVGASDFSHPALRDAFAGEMLPAEDFARVQRIDRNWVRKSRDAQATIDDIENARKTLFGTERTVDNVQVDAVSRARGRAAARPSPTEQALAEQMGRPLSTTATATPTRAVGSMTDAWFEARADAAMRARLAGQSDDIVSGIQAFRNLTPTSADPVARALHQRLLTALNRIEKSSSPRTMLSNLAVVRDTVGRARYLKAFDGIDAGYLDAIKRMARQEIRSSMRDLWGASRNKGRGAIGAELAALRAAERYIPARYMPRVFDDFDRQVRGAIDGASGWSDDVRVQATRALDERDYYTLNRIFDDGTGRATQLDAWLTDARAQWLDWKREGFDPVFVHHVDPADAARLDFPRIGQRIVEPSAARRRTFDYRPSENAPHVAITHQMKEMLELRANQELHETITRLYGETETQMMDRLTRAYGSDARRIAEETMVRWDPRVVFKQKGKTSNLPGARASDAIYVPRNINDTLGKLYQSATLDMLFDPVMKVFRTAVLPLSPRWHVYNVVGGGVITAANDPRAFMRFAEAYRKLGSGPAAAAKRAFRGDDTPLTSTVVGGGPPTRSGVSSVTIPDRLMSNLNTLPPTHPRRLVASRSFLGGQQMANWWNAIQEWRRSQPGGKGPFGRGVDASYAVNQWFDDFYRTATSIDAYERAVKAGKNTVEAEVEAARAVRSVMQNWDELLPAERVILRSLFPFYSWARFSIGFVARYPVDHPLRTAVLAQFARNEIEDMGTGLPQEFLGLFQLSGMDENGDARFARLSGFNPFRDTTDWFTLSGFVGQTNPVISATLQSLGVDPVSGGPTLYPNLRYDPESGRLVAENPGLVGNLIRNTLPQARLIENFTIGSARFAELVQSNPEAARRQLQGQLGLPILVQTENIPQEQFKAELARREVFDQAVRDAVQSGDFSGLDGFPGWLPAGPADAGMTLQAYLEQLAVADQLGQLEVFRPPRQGRSVRDLATSFAGFGQ